MAESAETVVRTRRRFTAPSVVVALAAMAVGVGVVIGTLFAWSPEPPLSEATPDRPEAVDSAATTFDGRFGVSVRARFDDGKPLGAPRWSGIVTSAGCEVGTSFTNGSSVARIDDIDRLAYTGSAPLYRNLERYFEGSDVVVLRRFLRSVGFEVDGESREFDYALSDAVREYSIIIGVPTATRVFDPNWVVWLPTESFLPGECLLQAGTQVSGGDVIARTSSVIADVQIVTERTEIPTSSLTLSLQSTTVPIDNDPLGVPAGSFADLAPHFTGVARTDNQTELIPAFVQLTDPIEAFTVPVTALVTQGSTTCVVSGTPEQFDVITVDVFESRAGNATVTPSNNDDTVASTVVRNGNTLNVADACLT